MLARPQRGPDYIDAIGFASCIPSGLERAGNGQPLWWIVTLKTYIIEDNAVIRENLVDTLEELADVKVVGFAETEVAALSWLQGHPAAWDLAIVDLFLREGSGIGVLEGCRDRPPNRKMVVLSNYATTDIRRRCGLIGADAVFDKSNQIDDLVDFCIAAGAAA